VVEASKQETTNLNSNGVKLNISWWLYLKIKIVWL
jgi:hypothetical protein